MFTWHTHVSFHGYEVWIHTIRLENLSIDPHWIVIRGQRLCITSMCPLDTNRIDTVVMIFGRCERGNEFIFIIWNSVHVMPIWYSVHVKMFWESLIVYWCELIFMPYLFITRIITIFCKFHLFGDNINNSSISSLSAFSCATHPHTWLPTSRNWSHVKCFHSVSQVGSSLFAPKYRFWWVCSDHRQRALLRRNVTYLAVNISTTKNNWFSWIIWTLRSPYPKIPRFGAQKVGSRECSEIFWICLPKNVENFR